MCDLYGEVEQGEGPGHGGVRDAGEGGGAQQQGAARVAAHLQVQGGTQRGK